MNKIIKTLIVLFVLVVGLSSTTSVFADYTWTEQTNSGAKAWKQMALSSDASRIVAVEHPGGSSSLYVSTDSGVTWNVLSGAGSRVWNGVASSASGDRLAAIVEGGYIYVSSDYGTTWNEVASSQSWTGITSSASGQYLAAVGWGSQIYTSDDYGATWVARDSVRNWTAITSSPDGSRLAAVTYSGGEPVYTSSDFGVTWTPQTNSNSGCWSYLTSFSSGNGIAVGNCTPGPVTISNDAGTTWNTSTSGNGTWYSVGTSDNGSVLAAADHSGSFKISIDGGSNWITQTDLGSKSWTYAVVSSDGSKIFALANGSNIYTGSVIIVPPPVIITVPTIATSTPTNISTTTVTLNATVTDDGNASTTVTGFNFGPDTDYGMTASTSNILGSGQNFSENISGLTCATTYHYAAFATNATGTATIADSVFTTDTCPAVSTSTPPDESTSTPPGNTPPPVPVVTPTVSYGTSGSRILFTTTSISSSPVPAVASPSCTTINITLRPGSQGEEVVKLQTLLNIPVTGNYDDVTRDAVKAFQIKYADEVLAPWGVTEPSGIAGFTTSKKLNELSCGHEFTLSPLEQYLINQYKENPASTSTPAIEVGSNTTAPEANANQTAGAANAEATQGVFKKISNFFKKIF